MEKSSGYDEKNSDELPNFELNIFDEPLSKVKRFANLSQREINDLAPVVQRVDSAIRWINHYPTDKCYQN